MRSQIPLSLAILTLAMAACATGHAQVVVQPVSPQVPYMAPITYETPYVSRFVTSAPVWAAPGPTYVQPASPYVVRRYVAPYTSTSPAIVAPSYSYRPWVAGRPIYNTVIPPAVPMGPVRTFYW